MNNGLKDIIIRLSRKMIRSFEYEQEFDTLFYFLNNYFDIREAKPATGPLKDLQDCDTLLLAIFHEACKKLNLDYWIDAGTLLGLHRHGGFIPWDDDLDACMLRDEYEKALVELPKLLDKYGIEVREFTQYPMSGFGIGYKHEQTGIWLDIYPVDAVQNVDESKAIPKLESNLWKYKKWYLKNRHRKTHAQLIEKKQQIINYGLEEGNDELLFLTVEYDYYKIIRNNRNNIFPLEVANFEGYEVNVPKKIPEYLSSIYGDNYMMFPRNGVAHHGGDSGKLYEWAKNSHTDMHQVYDELNRAYQDIKG